MLLIFDWDGTLSDSTAKIVRCVQAAAKDFNVPMQTDDAVKDIIGLSLTEAFRVLYPALSESDRGALSDRYSDIFIAADQSPSAFYRGVEESLAVLRASGFRLAIATGKSRKGLDRVLGNLGWSTFFDATRCADESASKPAPLMLTQLLDYFGATSDQAVMVGDTEYDMAMARSAMMPRIAVSYGAHHIDRLRPYAPVLCLDQFKDLLNWQPLAERLDASSP